MVSELCFKTVFCRVILLYAIAAIGCRTTVDLDLVLAEDLVKQDRFYENDSWLLSFQLLRHAVKRNINKMPRAFLSLTFCLDRKGQNILRNAVIPMQKNNQIIVD